MATAMPSGFRGFRTLPTTRRVSLRVYAATLFQFSVGCYGILITDCELLGKAGVIKEAPDKFGPF